MASENTFDDIRVLSATPGGPDPLRLAAEEVEATWVWVLDGTARPRADTLAALVRAAAPGGGVPAPVLLASAVLGPDGAPDPGHAPWHRRGGSDLAMRAVRHGLLPIRAARAGALLIRADAARAAGPPRAGALEWTARILRDAHGYLVTASRADATAPATWRHDALGRTAREDARRVAAALAGPAFAGKERLWIAGEALGRLTAAGRRPAAPSRPS
jgi:hypothetical protein